MGNGRPTHVSTSCSPLLSFCLWSGASDRLSVQRLQAEWRLVLVQAGTSEVGHGQTGTPVWDEIKGDTSYKGKQPVTEHGPQRSGTVQVDRCRRSSFTLTLLGWRVSGSQRCCYHTRLKMTALLQIRGKRGIFLSLCTSVGVSCAFFVSLYTVAYTWYIQWLLYHTHFPFHTAQWERCPLPPAIES